MSRQILFIFVFSFNSILTQRECINTSNLPEPEELEQPLVTIIGTGYVGLVTGAGLAALGNTVLCVDINQAKIDLLSRGEIPIYEPGLQELVTYEMSQNKLSFSTDIAYAIQQATIIFIAVDTPMNDDGNADLRTLLNVIHTIANNLYSHKIIVTKSTVPVGTGYSIERILRDTYGLSQNQFTVVSNPEFLREGSAVQDFLHPDRIVIGSEKNEGFEKLTQLYQHLVEEEIPFIYTNIATAELIKYAANAFLATKLSFINEIANLCDATGAHIKTVAYAMGLDKRISPRFLNPGPGYGGSCFPKDTQALLHIAHKHNVLVNTVDGAIKTNKLQQLVPVKKLNRIMPVCNGKTIAVLGLAFKANTDDIRYSPAITVIQELLAQGALVRAYDPKAMYNFTKIFPAVTYCSSIYEALENVDAAIIMTEWEEFKDIDLDAAKSLMHRLILIDARNILDACQVTQAGFYYDNIGCATQYIR